MRRSLRLLIQMAPGQLVLQDLECLFGSICPAEQVAINRRDCPLLHQDVEIEHAAPIGRAVDDDADVFGQLLGLRQREQLEELIQRSESSGEDNQRLGQVGEP